MVNALVKLDENVNRILNIVKARHGFKDKSEAIDFIIKRFVEEEGEPELREDFIEKMFKIQDQKSILVDDFEKRYGLN